MDPWKKKLHLSNVQNPVDIPLYLLFNGDPYVMAYETTPYNRLVNVIPGSPQYRNNQGQLVTAHLSLRTSIQHENYMKSSYERSNISHCVQAAKYVFM